MAAALLALWAGLQADASRAGTASWNGDPDVDQSGRDVVFSPYTYHYNREPHAHVLLFGAESRRSDGWLYGASLFRNSFGQPSGYAFAGHRYVDPWNWRGAYYAWTAGVIYGYKGEHKDEIKPNAHGFAPGIIPRVGYQVNPQWSVEIATLGFAAMMFNISIALPDR